MSGWLLNGRPPQRNATIPGKWYNTREMVHHHEKTRRRKCHVLKIGPFRSFLDPSTKVLRECRCCPVLLKLLLDERKKHRRNFEAGISDMTEHHVAEAKLKFASALNIRFSLGTTRIPLLPASVSNIFLPDMIV